MDDRRPETPENPESDVPQQLLLFWLLDGTPFIYVGQLEDTLIGVSFVLTARDPPE
jgi:hypothetical protein